MPERISRAEDRDLRHQVREIEAAGFAVEKRQTVTESVSGSSAIKQRPDVMTDVMKLLDRLGTRRRVGSDEAGSLGPATRSMSRRRLADWPRWVFAFTAWRWAASI